MSSCSNSVNKYIIVEASADQGTFSGLTVCGGGGITVDFITGCTVDGVQIEGALLQGNTLTVPTLYASTISGSTFYGVTDSYMTGGTYATGFITFEGNNNFSDVVVDVSALLDDTNTYVTGGTVNGGTLTLTRNDGVDVVVTGFSQTFTGNTSSTCITDIYVSNIHSCSPLHINPLDEGNVYFGSTSGVTIDVLNSNVIINSLNNQDEILIVGPNKEIISTGVLTIDPINKFVGINQNNPQVTLHMTGEGSQTAQIRMEQYDSSIDAPDIRTRKAYGTASSPSVPPAGTYLFRQNIERYNGAGWTTMHSQQFDLDGTDGTKGIYQLQTHNGSSLATRYSIDKDGDHTLNGDVNVTGVLNVGTINSGTIVNNLGYDSSGNIIIGSITTDTNTFVSGGTYNTGTQEINFVGNSPETTFDVDLSSIISVDTYVTGFTFNPSTYDLTIKQNEGQPDLVSNLAVLASDVYVVSGVYNPSTGIVTYTNSSGGTFQVSGFTTGMTDSYTTSAVLNGETIEFDNNIQGSNLYSVSLTPVLSGKTDLTLFNSHTGDTNNPHQTSFGNLISTAHTHTISDITNLQTELDSKLNISNFNTYSGNVQTQLDTKVENGVNSGNGSEVFSGKSGTDLYFRTLSGGTNTTITTVGDILKVDVSLPPSMNTYVTGGTYNDSTDTITLSRNDGNTIDITGVTDNYVIAGTYIDSTDTIALLRKNGSFVNITGVTDTFTTGATYDNGTATATFTKNDGTTYSLDLSSIDVNDTFVTGGTYTTGTLTLDRNDGTSVLVTGFLTGNTLQEVLVNGNTTGGKDIIMTEGDDIIFKYAGWNNSINTNPLTTHRNILFPDKDGTVALISDTTGHTENYYVTGFTYNDVNTFTISRSGGLGDLTSTISVLSGVTYYGDGSNLDGISSTDYYVTGGTYSSDILTLNRGNGSVNIDLPDVYITGGTLNVNTLELYRNQGLPTISIDLGDLSPTGSTIDTYVTGATLNGNNLEISRNQGEPTLTVDLSQYVNTDRFVTGATMNGNVLELSRSGGLSNVTVDLSQFIDNTNYYVTGGTVSGTDLVLGRNGGLSDVTIDTSAYFDNTDNYVTGATYSNANLYFSGTSGNQSFVVDVSALLDDTNDGVVSGATMNGNTLELSRTQGLSNVTVDLSQFDNNTDRFVTGATMNGNTLELSRSGGLSDVTVDLSQFVDNTNYYVTGGTVSGTDLVLGRNGGLSDITIDTSAYFDNTDNYVTGGTYSNDVLTLNRTNGSVNIDLPETYVTGVTLNGNNLEITRNQGLPTLSVDLSQFIDDTDTFVSGGTYSNGNLYFSGNSSETTFTVDVSGLLDDTNNYVTGGTVSGTDLVLYRNGGLSDITIDTSAYFDNTDRFVTGATMNGNILELSRSGGLSDVTVDLSQFIDDTNYYVTGFTYNDANVFTLSRNGGLSDLSVTADTMENLTITETFISQRFSNLNAVTASTISQLDYIDFNTTYTPTQQEGRLHWDADFGTLDVDLEGNTTHLKVGLDNLYYIKNQSGTTIQKGKVVRAAGTLGSSGRLLGEYMVADGTIPFYYTLGIAGENIPDGEDGYVYEFGLVKGVNATGSLYGETWSGGTILYVHPTIHGGLTSVEPTEPNLKIQMAIVINAASNGSIFVRPDLSRNLNDLHNVQTSGETDGDLISYNSSQGYWDYTKSLRGDYTVDGSLSASTISAVTINAMTYNNLPVDPNYYVTGGTYSDGLYTFNRNDGNSFSIEGGSNYSAGVIEGSSGWTSTGTGQIYLPEVKVALYDNPNNIEPLRVYTISSGTTGSGGVSGLTNNDTNYVYIDYNGGSPNYGVSTDYSVINDSSTVIVYTIYRLNNFIHILEFGDFGAGLPNKLNDRIILTERFKRETGLSLGLSGSTGVITLTEGIAWNASNRQVIEAVNSQDDIFFKNYHVSGVWSYTTTGDTINNTFYDDGTDLVTATGGKYLVNWYYRGQEVNDHLYEVYGTSQYDSVADAELSTEPALPELITSHAFLTGRIIVGVGQNTGYTQSAFVTTFQSTNIQNHDDLTGLQGGTAGEYYHLTASEYTNNAYTNVDNNFSTDQTINGSLTVNTISASTYQGLPVDPNYYVTGGTVSGTDLLLNRNDGSTVTIDTSSYFDNKNVTGGTVSGTDLLLDLSDGSNVTIDTSSYFDNTDNYLTGGTLNNNSIEFNRTNALNILTISGGSGIIITEPTTGVFSVQSTGGAGGGEANTASNLGGGTGLFGQKSGVDLQFKSLTSTGGTVTISNDSTTVNVEVKDLVSDANKIFSWYMNVT